MTGKSSSQFSIGPLFLHCQLTNLSSSVCPLDRTTQGLRRRSWPDCFWVPQITFAIDFAGWYLEANVVWFPIAHPALAKIWVNPYKVVIPMRNYSRMSGKLPNFASWPR